MTYAELYVQSRNWPAIWDVLDVTSETDIDRDALMEAAALWFARMDSGSASFEDFETWRNSDPRHAAAFAQIAAVSRKLDSAKQIDPKALVQPVLPNRRTLLAASLGLFGALGVGAVTFTLTGGSRLHAETSAGGRKAITLPDGGHLDVNTDSKVSWQFDSRHRRIWLERGEISLNLSDDPYPWQLFAGNQVVRVARGVVNARLRGEVLDLTVVTGHCVANAKNASSVGPSRGDVAGSSGDDNHVPHSFVTVEAGQGALLGNEAPHIRKLSLDDIEFVSSWRQDELIFKGQSLSAAIAEYNRYLRHKITIADPSLDSLKLGGRFTTHDPAVFLNALQSSFAIHVSTEANGDILLSR